jgi:hypothetical protein
MLLYYPQHYRKPRLTAVGIRCADHATPSTRKRLALTSPTSGGRSVGIVRLRTTATEFSFFYYRVPGICPLSSILKGHNVSGLHLFPS